MSLPMSPSKPITTTLDVLEEQIPAADDPMLPAAPTLRPPVGVLPRIPADFVPLPRLLFRGVWPRQEELSMLEGAIDELTAFHDYRESLGRTLPPHQVALQIFTEAHEWSLVRRQLGAWQDYAETQETRAWVQLRDLLKPMKWGFDALAKYQPTLAAQFPALMRLLRAPSEAAKRAATARQANQAEIAAGRPPYKGGAGKLRQRSAARAALKKEEEE